VAAACVLPRQLEDELVQSGLDDSKRMGDELRASLSDRIRTEAHYGLGVVGAARIDETDILRASLEAMRHAVDALVTAYGHYPDCLLVDGKDVITPAPWPGARQHALVRGDGRAVCIAAASVIAKVHRDRLMIDYDAQYPGYGFAANKGYGAAEHRDALRRLGPSPIHRRSFGASADDSAETQASLF
jgi:ribonuclease HII